MKSMVRKFFIRLFGVTREEIRQFLKRITSVARMTIPPGETNLVHNHPNDEQIYLILEGSGSVQIGDERVEVDEGDVISLPANIPHAFYNTTHNETIVLNVGCKVN